MIRKTATAVCGAAARSGPLPRDLHALGTSTPLAQVVLRSQVDGQLQYGAEGAFVFVIGDDQRAARRELALGRANAGRVEVRSGLAVAERVVVEGVARLHDGRDVLLVDPQP